MTPILDRIRAYYHVRTSASPGSVLLDIPHYVLTKAEARELCREVASMGVYRDEGQGPLSITTCFGLPIRITDDPNAE